MINSKKPQKQPFGCELIPIDLHWWDLTCHMDAHLSAGSGALQDYASTKGAIVSFTKGLSQGLIKKVCPSESMSLKISR